MEPAIHMQGLARAVIQLSVSYRPHGIRYI
jgi:hypothetical protein